MSLYLNSLGENIMKKAVFLMLLVVLAGCSTETDQVVQDVTSKVHDQISNIADQSNENVLNVKNGHLQSYPDESIGETFDRSFEGNTWKYFKAESGEDVVEFTGYTEYRDEKVKARLQFILNGTSTFETAALSFNDVPQDNMVRAALLKSIFERKVNELEIESTAISTNETTNGSEEKSKVIAKETESEQTIPSKKDVFPKLSYDEKKKLNLFFSNLSEAYFSQFNKDNYNVEQLIDFAVVHNKINYANRIKTTQVKGGSYDELDSKHVIDTVKRFFGIEIKAKATEVYPLEGGNYHWPSADGEQYMNFSQIINFYDNRNGTFTAEIQIYTSDFESQGESVLYEPKDEAWGNDIGYDNYGTATAVVKKAKLLNKDTYQVIEYKVINK